MAIADYELIVTASNGGTPVSTTFTLEVISSTDNVATAPSIDNVIEVVENNVIVD